MWLCATVQGRKEATALPVKDVEVDALRMTLNFVHPYGKSGDTPPSLSFTRGESIEERRKALNETKQRNPDAGGSGEKRKRLVRHRAQQGEPWTDPTEDDPVNVQPDEGGIPSASAVVMASIESKCITVSRLQGDPYHKPERGPAPDAGEIGASGRRLWPNPPPP